MARAGRPSSPRAARVAEVVGEARAAPPADGARPPSTATPTSGWGATRPATARGARATPPTTGPPPTPTSPPTCCGGTSACSRALDVGCARGYLVEALRELGVDAHGCDVSRYAVEHAAPGALGYVPARRPLARPALRRRRVRAGLRPRDPRAPRPRPGARRPGRAAPGLRGRRLRHHPLVRPQRLGARRPLRRQGPPRAARALPRPRPGLRRARCPPRTWPSTPTGGRSRAT